MTNQETCYLCGEPLYNVSSEWIGRDILACNKHLKEERQCYECGKIKYIRDLNLVNDSWYCKGGCR